MSQPCVWNGRNEKILGSGSVGTSDDKAKDMPVSEDNSPSLIPSGNEDRKGDAAHSAPSKSVWNGKHKKLLGIRDKSSETNDTTVSKVDAQLPSLMTKNGSPITQQTHRVAVVTAAKNDIKSSIQVHNQHGKEDEGTNSTAGSSTTNLDEDAGEEPVTSSSPSREINEVTKVQPDRIPTSGNKHGGEQIEEASIPNSSNSTRNDSSRQISTGASSDLSITSRRPTPQSSGNKGGGRSYNYSGNNNGRPNYVRGSNNGTGRRRGEHVQGSVRGGNTGRLDAGTRGYGRAELANGATASSMPICTFFVRGICNRGSSCAFTHDPAYAPEPKKKLTPSDGQYDQLTRNKALKGNTRQEVAGPIRFYAPRVFDPFKAKAIQLTKAAQDNEDRSNFASPTKTSIEEDPNNAHEPPFFSIDVECIATGCGHCARGINDGCGNEGKNGIGVPPTQFSDRSHRYPGRVAMVDIDGYVLADIIIRPPNGGSGVVSYLTPLTGLTEDMCLGPGAKPLEEAVKIIRSFLPKNAVLVGQAIGKDVEWLGLSQSNQDFGRMVDICEIFSQRMPTNLADAADVVKKKEEDHILLSSSSKKVVRETNAGLCGVPSLDATADLSSDEYLGFATRYRWFSLRHACINLLSNDIQSGVHDPILDAQYSLLLFHKYRNASSTEIRVVRDALHRAPRTPGFAVEKTPVIDGVCVSAAGYPHKDAARTIWLWYKGKNARKVSSV